jgi:hypothetical protein
MEQDSSIIIPIAGIDYPKYEYTYKVISISFDTAHFLVDYFPTDTRFIKITYNLPILTTFKIDEINEYIDQWAPHDKWYAQEIILQHGNSILGI